MGSRDSINKISAVKDTYHQALTKLVRNIYITRRTCQHNDYLYSTYHGPTMYCAQLSMILMEHQLLSGAGMSLSFSQERALRYSSLIEVL